MWSELGGATRDVVDVVRGRLNMARLWLGVAIWDVVEACLMPYVRVHMQVPQQSVVGLHVHVHILLPYLLACMQICFHGDLCCV